MEYGISSCYKCRSENIITDFAEGDIICQDCGEVNGSGIIDNSVDWRISSTDDSYDGEAHARSSTLRMDESGATLITGDSSVLSEALKNAHSSISYMREDKQINTGAGSIAEFGGKLKISSEIIMKAIELYRSAIQGGRMRCNKDGLIGAVIYLACRQDGYPRTLQEIANIMLLDKQTIGKISKELVNVLGLSNETGRVLASSLVERMVSQLQLSFKVADYARHCCQQVQDLGILDGIQPNVVAGAVILYIHGIMIAPILVPPTFLKTLAAVSLTKSPASVLKSHSVLVQYRSAITPKSLVTLPCTDCSADSPVRCSVDSNINNKSIAASMSVDVPILRPVMSQPIPTPVVDLVSSSRLIPIELNTSMTSVVDPLQYPSPCKGINDTTTESHESADCSMCSVLTDVPVHSESPVDVCSINNDDDNCDTPELYRQSSCCTLLDSSRKRGCIVVMDCVGIPVVDVGYDHSVDGVYQKRTKVC